MITRSALTSSPAWNPAPRTSNALHHSEHVVAEADRSQGGSGGCAGITLRTPRPLWPLWTRNGRISACRILSDLEDPLVPLVLYTRPMQGRQTEREAMARLPRPLLLKYVDIGPPFWKRGSRDIANGRRHSGYRTVSANIIQEGVASPHWWAQSYAPVLRVCQVLQPSQEGQC